MKSRSYSVLLVTTRLTKRCWILINLLADRTMEEALHPIYNLYNAYNYKYTYRLLHRSYILFKAYIRIIYDDFDCGLFGSLFSFFLCLRLPFLALLLLLQQCLEIFHSEVILVVLEPFLHGDLPLLPLCFEAGLHVRIIGGSPLILS
jgi:hypothetical protein